MGLAMSFFITLCRVQGRITTSSTSLLCTSWHVTAAEAARLMFYSRPVWNSGSLSDPHNLTAPSILELTSFTLPVFRAKHLNTVYRYKVGAQRTIVLRDDLAVSGQ